MHKAARQLHRTGSLPVTMWADHDVRSSGHGVWLICEHWCCRCWRHCLGRMPTPLTAPRWTSTHWVSSAGASYHMQTTHGDAAQGW